MTVLSPRACLCRPGDDLAPELKELSLTIFIASVAGFLFGGMIGARHSGDKFITHNHASKFTSVMQAQVSHRGGPTGAVQLK